MGSTCGPELQDAPLRNLTVFFLRDSKTNLQPLLEVIPKSLGAVLQLVRPGLSLIIKLLD